MSQNNNILRIMDKAKIIGYTSKQIALQLGIDEAIVKRELTELYKNNLISRVGRNLWILKKYEEMTMDSLFVNPESYVHTFQRNFKIQFSNYSEGITFSKNGTKAIHKWSPYIQGFSAEFVNDMLSKYSLRRGCKVLDPFCGSGTVLVCSKMRGINSMGVDLMPLMTFMASVKTNWNLDIQRIKDFLTPFDKIKDSKIEISKPFLKETDRQFSPEVLDNLLRIKQFVWNVCEKDTSIGNLLKLALTSILVPCSNLKRSPCLGYVKNKKVPNQLPFKLFLEKVNDMLTDLDGVQQYVKAPGKVWVRKEDAREALYEKGEFDIAITSPPYVNGMDYVINYKIEMAWLELIKSYEELTKLKERMVVCDNVSKKLIQSYSPSYSDTWLDDIESRIAKRLQEKENYRRRDMHLIVRKYFDDLYPILSNVYDALKAGGRFLIVIGDSLMAGIYIPADLIVAQMGKQIGYSIEDLMIARERRSGQRRDFRLRESIVVLRKG